MSTLISNYKLSWVGDWGTNSRYSQHFLKVSSKIDSIFKLCQWHTQFLTVFKIFVLSNFNHHHTHYCGDYQWRGIPLTSQNHQFLCHSVCLLCSWGILVVDVYVYCSPDNISFTHVQICWKLSRNHNERSKFNCKIKCFLITEEKDSHHVCITNWPSWSLRTESFDFSRQSSGK